MAQPGPNERVNFGDIVAIEFGLPIGSETGFLRPGIVLTSDAFLPFRPTTVFVVPLTSTPRTFPSHVEIAPDETNGLNRVSYALVEQLRAVATERCSTPSGNVGPAVTHQVLDIIAMITGMP
jgi:mRNA interferase MazF